MKISLLLLSFFILTMTTSLAVASSPAEQTSGAAVQSGAATPPAATTSSQAPATTPQENSPMQSTPSAEAQPSKPSVIPNIVVAPNAHGQTITRLANGLNVLVKEDHRFPLVSLRLYVHAGSVYENPQKAGISHLLEHMVFKGTASYPESSIATTIESTGGYLNAATSFDYTMYLTDMTSESWAQGLKVLKEMAFNPTIDPAALESEKEVVIAELKRGLDSPSNLLFQMAQAAALGGTPYATPIIGFEDTIRGISSQDMHQYMNNLYHPHSMLLLVIGDISTKDALTQIEAVFGNIPASAEQKNTPLPKLPTPTLATVEQKTQVQKGPWNKVQLAVAIPVAGYGEMDAAQLDVLSQLLASDATSHFTKIFQYEKRMVDSISMSNATFEQVGLLYMQAVMDADKLQEFWQAFSLELGKLSQVNFTPEQIKRAKLSLEDSLFRSKETLAGYASKLGYFQFFGRGETDENNYLQTVNSTTQEQLTNLIKSTFIPKNISINVLLPESMTLDGGPDAFGAWMRQVLDTNLASSATGEKSVKTDKTTVSSQPEIIDLGNNRTLILEYDPTLPYTAVNLRFLGGERLLVPAQAGLAQFTASLLSRGTKEMSMQDVEAFMADRAASMAATSGKHSMNIGIDTPEKYLQDMLGLLEQAVNTPAFLDEEAIRVKETQISAITMREDQPTGLAFRRIFPFLFGEELYGLPTLGYKATIETFAATDAQSLWNRQKQYPWVLSVAGDFDRDMIMEFVKQLPVPKVTQPPLAKTTWGKNKELDLTLKDRNQAHLLMLFPTVGVEHPDKAGLNLLQTILAGQSGLLFKDLRDKQGLGYTVTAVGWESLDTGFMTFYIGTNPEQVDQALEGFNKVIKNLHENPLSVEDVLRGQNQIRGDYYRAQQTLQGRSSEKADLLALGLGINANKELLEKTEKLTAADLQALAKKYLLPAKAYMVKVLPSK